MVRDLIIFNQRGDDMNNEVDISTTVGADNRDWFLSTIISSVNGNDTEIPITLNTGGFLVSGLLISGHKYFDGLAELLTENSKNVKLVNVLKEGFSKLGETLYNQNKDAEIKNRGINYIHLRNAKFFNTNSNPIPGNQGVFWRGRLSEISGFCLGILTPEKPE